MFLPYLLHIPLLLLLIILFKKRRNEDPLLKFYNWGLAIKLLAGIAVGILYFFFYKNEGDSFVFQKYSSALTQLLFTNPHEYFNIFFFTNLSEESQQVLQYYDEPRAFFYIKVLSLLNILSFSNYWINGLYLSLFSFLGSWILSNSIVKIFNVSEWVAAFSFLFLPSFVFWTSGVLKESFGIGALFLIIAFSLQYIHQRKTTFLKILLLILLLFCCWKLKFYYVLVTVPTLISYFFIILIEEKFSIIKNPILAALSFISIFSLLAVTSVFLIPSLSFQYIWEIIFHSYKVIYQYSLSAGKVAYELEDMGPELFKILKNSPEALWAGLIRPYLWESPMNFALLAGLENLFILGLLAGKVFRLMKAPKKVNAETIALIVYILLSATLLALIAPNWGTLSRYKTAFLPFWILLLSIDNPVFAYLEKIGDNLIKAKSKKHV